MEFAIIQTGGKQYRVAPGDEIAVEKIKGDYKIGDKITIESVIMKDDGKNATFGAPFIDGAKVEATITESGKLDKVMVVKYRPKSRYHKRNGHRQPYMAIKIDAIK